MKLLKIIDVSAQCILFLICILSIFTGFRFIYTYCILGGWQVASFIVHATVEKNLFFQKERAGYGKWLLAMAAFGLLALAFYAAGIFEAVLLVLLILLAVPPFLAIWYISICVREVGLLNRKALVHLK